jgi:hypothetical protein
MVSAKLDKYYRPPSPKTEHSHNFRFKPEQQPLITLSIIFWKYVFFLPNAGKGINRRC